MENEKLINETVQSLKDFLPKVSNSCISIADDLRSDNENSAMQEIKQFIDAIGWSIQAINGIKSLGYLLDIETSDINEYLIEAQEGLAINDLVIIADMFEYEFHPRIEEWINKVNQFKGA